MAQHSRAVARARAAGVPRANVVDQQDIGEWTQYLALVNPTHPNNARTVKPQHVAEYYRATATQVQLPTMCSLAGKWLGCPASQASCERVFSSMNIVVVATRLSLSPDIVEIQTLFRLNARKAIALGWIK